MVAYGLRSARWPYKRIGLECRSDDSATRQLLAQIDDPATRSAVEAERSLLYHLGGGCQVPLGALATVNDPLVVIVPLRTFPSAPTLVTVPVCRSLVPQVMPVPDT